MCSAESSNLGKTWISVKMSQSSVCLSGVTFHTHLPHHLPVYLHPFPAESWWEGGWGGETIASPTFPLSCRELSFVSCIPFPIHFFPSPQLLSYSFTWGRGVLKIPPPPSSVLLNRTSPSILCFTWLVKQQSAKKGRRCILSGFSLSLRMYQGVELRLIFNDWFIEKKKKMEEWGGLGLFPAGRLHTAWLSHTHYCSWSLGLSQRSL